MSVIPTPLNNVEQIAERINTLQESLKAGSPVYESLLHTIHVALHKDEELVHLLTEEQIGVIVSGLAKKKNIVIAEPVTKSGGSRTPSGKKLKDLTLDDL